MSKHATRIEYADSSVNPVMGCSGCELYNQRTRTCYAAAMTKEWGGRKGWPVNFLRPTTFPGRFDEVIRSRDLRNTKRPTKPWLNDKRRHVFVSDMGDQFDDAIPFTFTASEVIDAIRTPKGQKHFFVLFTKRARRMTEFIEWYRSERGSLPENIIWMVSVTSQASMRRLDELLSAPGIMRGVSFEPLLQPVSFLPSVVASGHDLHWIVSAPESGELRRHSKANWFRQLRDDAAALGVPFFLKHSVSPSGVKESTPELDGVRHVAMFNSDGDLLL